MANKTQEAKNDKARSAHIEKLFNSLTRKDWQGAAVVDIRREDIAGDNADEWALFILLAHKATGEDYEELNDTPLEDLIKKVYPEDLWPEEVK